MLVGLSFMAVLVLLPMAVVFAEALKNGFTAYRTALLDPLSPVGDPAHPAGGRHRRTVQRAVRAGRVRGLSPSSILRASACLITFIDLPFSVSPVISGVIYILLFGAHSVIGGWLAEHDIQIVFAVPGW